MPTKTLRIGGIPFRTVDNNDGTSTIKTAGGGNVTNKFREAFEDYTPGETWAEVLGDGDIIALDGNAAAASYLSISKSPLRAGTVSSITTIEAFEMPFDLTVGLGTSQRTLGQEFSIEAISGEPSIGIPADLAIASIQQAASVLTVQTTVPHGLRPGMRIGIRGCSDRRLNYPSLVVASTPVPAGGTPESSVQFTVTAGPMGNLPSITAGPFANGSVYFRSSLGGAQNGTSMTLENATATNASYYARSESGDALPSGTILGNHAVTILSTVSFQAINAAGVYSFQPTNAYRLTQLIDGLQWSDAIVDTIGAANNRRKIEQVVPDPSAMYHVRIRATNNASLTTPNAQIISAVKTGTTTATITTDGAHGLTITDQIVIYGIRDQSATAFPNLLAATAVASVIDATTFTVVIGTAATVTSYGGYVASVDGGNLMSALGASASVIQSIQRTSNVLTVNFGVAPTGIVIGDYVNLIGVRSAVDGSSLGIDGAYRVQNLVTTVLTLERINATASPGGIDIGLTNCGGSLIKRTCLRLSFVRVLDFERTRVEMLARPIGDESGAAPVRIQNTPAVTIGSGTVTTVSTVSALTGGGAAEDAAAGANPVVTGGVVRTATTPTSLVAGDAVRDTHASSGAKVTKPYAVPEAAWNASLALTTTTAQALAVAAGAGLKRHITAAQVINTGTAVDLIILDGATERWRLPLPQNVPVPLEFPTELLTTVNTALNANLSAVGTVRINAQGYTSA